MSKKSNKKAKTDAKVKTCEKVKTDAKVKNCTKSKLKYKRILLKLSGEALMGEYDYGLDTKMVKKIAKEIADVYELGVEVCIVLGGGNIFRGISKVASEIERTTADYMGMLATIMNALAMQAALEKIGLDTRVLSAVRMQTICEPYIRRRAARHLEKGRIVIFAAGTGNPFFTTDTGAALRANEMGCDVLLKATKVDGIYDCDPMLNKNAKKYKKLAYRDVLKDDLKVLDGTAVTLCRDNDIPIIIFSIYKKDAVKNILQFKGDYTIVEKYSNKKMAIKGS